MTEGHAWEKLVAEWPFPLPVADAPAVALAEADGSWSFAVLGSAAAPLATPPVRYAAVRESGVSMFHAAGAYREQVEAAYIMKLVRVVDDLVDAIEILELKHEAGVDVSASAVKELERIGRLHLEAEAMRCAVAVSPMLRRLEALINWPSLGYEEA